MTVRILHGDCRDLLPTLGAESVDAVVTDPPYGLGFMGKGWDHGVPGVEFWTAIMRTMKPGAYLLAFGGTRTYHRLVCAIEDAGFEVRDMISWIYGSGFPKGTDRMKVPEAWRDDWNTALKPALEPICLARKPMPGPLAANLEAYGTGAMNIGACRIPVDPAADASQLRTMNRGQRSEDTSGQVWGLSKAAGDAPEVVRADGRWPANVVHDGSEEVMAAFPEVESGKPAGIKAGNNNNVFGRFAGGIPVTGFGDSGSAARFFYCAKADREDREHGLQGHQLRQGGIRSETSGQHITRRDGGAPGPVANHHPTVKPTELMRWLVRLVTPKGGTVLDPFLGSGSTGRAAVLEGFDFIGMEREAEYVPIAEARIGIVNPDSFALGAGD
jgi:site-specific DNA-methyltransferase (adenine-specific)